MNIKRIAALTIAFSCVTSLVPSTLSIGNVSVYAASTGDTLQDISLETSKGKDITIYTKSTCTSKSKLSKLNSDDKVPLNLYAKVSSSVTKVNFKDVDLKGDGVDYEIRKGSTKINLDEDVKISSSTSFYIDVLGSDKEVIETYKLKVTKESKNDTEDDYDDDDNNDDIYLDNLELTTFDNKDIKLSFKKTTSSYNVSVANTVTSVKICAEPEYDDYTVRINGTKIDEDDDWTKKVSLSEGKNEIPVKIKDDDGNERVYTLNITRASSTGSSTDNNTNSNTNNSTNNGANNNTNNNTNQSPSTTAPTFSTAKLGWVAQGGNWYFVQPDGKAATGWVYSGNHWYYMNTNGTMKTGWLQSPISNKWYYLYSDGHMASNTTIGGYRLGSDGAWIQ